MMKPLMKFGAVLLGFGLILSMVVVVIIRGHAIPDAPSKVAPVASASSTLGPAQSSAPNSAAKN